MGFALPNELLRSRCALTAPFHPYRLRRRYVFCGTFRKTRFERALPAVSRHAALWRPDFPLPRPFRTAAAAVHSPTVPVRLLHDKSRNVMRQMASYVEVSVNYTYNVSAQGSVMQRTISN